MDLLGFTDKRPLVSPQIRNELTWEIIHFSQTPNVKHKNSNQTLQHAKSKDERNKTFSNFKQTIDRKRLGCVDSPQRNNRRFSFVRLTDRAQAEPLYHIALGGVPQVPPPTEAQMSRNEITPLSRSRALRENPFRCI